MVWSFVCPELPELVSSWNCFMRFAQFFVLELPWLCIECLHYCKVCFNPRKIWRSEYLLPGYSIHIKARTQQAFAHGRRGSFNVVSSKEPVTSVSLPGQGCQHAGGQTLPGSKCPVHYWWCQIIRQEALRQMHSADVCMSQQVVERWANFWGWGIVIVRGPCEGKYSAIEQFRWGISSSWLLGRHFLLIFACMSSAIMPGTCFPKIGMCIIRLGQAFLVRKSKGAGGDLGDCQHPLCICLRDRRRMYWDYCPASPGWASI